MNNPVGGSEGLSPACPRDDEPPAPGGQFHDPDPPALALGERAAPRPPPQPAQGAFPSRISYSRRHAERWVRLITWPGPAVPPTGLFIVSSSCVGFGTDDRGG